MNDFIGINLPTIIIIDIEANEKYKGGYKMIPDKMMDVLSHEGVVSIVTQGDSEPHVINTWNSYLKIAQDGSILAPVGGMKTTEANIKRNNSVQMTLGSREVQGFNSMGTGFLIRGTASVMEQGNEYNEIKGRFPWARAALVVKPDSITQTL